LYRSDRNAFSPEDLARLTSVGEALAQSLILTADRAMAGT
jgi:hypothetical protein